MKGIDAELTKIYQEPPVTLPLVLGHRHYTRHIIFLHAVLLLREIPHQMAPLFVILRQHIEQKRFHVIIQSLVVQEQLRQQTQVLAVDLIDIPIHLEH